MGELKRRGRVWWIRYYRDGRRFEESSGSTKETDARRLLRLREGDVERGLPVSPRIARLRFDEAAADVLNDYRINRKRTLPDVETRLRLHLMPFFSGRRLSTITTADVREYVAQRQAETVMVRRGHDVKNRDGTLRHVPEQRRTIARVSNAEINRELTLLKRVFVLALQAGKLLHRPHIPMLQEHNVRVGFLESEQFQNVRAHLPGAIQPVVTFAYITGWRIPSEVLPLQWRQVDFVTSDVRLDPDTTKNGEGRVFPFTSELRDLLEKQREIRDSLKRSQGLICPWVFHRNGRPIKTFVTVWRHACRRAGCPGRIPHDFRRTAVRNLVRAGIVESVAMKMTGHKTRSVFERYNITSDGDLRQAARKLDEAAQLKPLTKDEHSSDVAS
jgi:integrase